MRRWGIGVAIGLVGLGAVAWAVLRAKGPVPTVGGTNVVLLVGCTLRADQLAAYGNDVDPTPTLTRWASEGAVYLNNLSTAPWTKPSTAAIVSGRWPTALGMATRKRGLDTRKLPDDAVTLAERLHAAGYRTHGGAANPNAGGVFGFDQGFDAYFNPDKLWREGAEGKVDGAGVVDAVLQSLAKTEDGRPFYLQLLLVDAHEPYDQGEAWKAWSAPGVSRKVAMYRAMLAHFDAQVARLEQGLTALGHDAHDTVFVFVGDHGEGLNLPPHHGWGHGNYLYASTVHVPFVVRGPGVAPGTRIEALTSSVDVLPTTLGLVKVPSDAPTDGLDQSPWARGATGPTRPDALVTTFFKGIDRAAVYTADRSCQKSYGLAPPPKKKRKRPPFDDACYDWRADPDAVVPVDDPALMARLDAAHAAAIADLDARDAGRVPEADLDAATRSALEGLGYLRGVDADDDE